MIEQKFLKLLLNNKFYEEVKEKIPKDTFADFPRKLLEGIIACQERLHRDLQIDEVKEIYFAENSGLTTAQKHAFELLCDNIKLSEDLKIDTGKLILEGLWKAELGKEIVRVGAEYINGNITDLNELDKLSKRFSSITTDEFEKPITTSVGNIISVLDSRPSWKINLPTINEYLGGMSGGEFLVLLARPESGKTACLTHLVSAPGGFASQGASVHIICNEEPAIRTMIRHVSAYTGMTKEEIILYPEKAEQEFSKIGRNIHIVDDVTMTMGKLDKYCRIKKPDVLIVDQLDRVSISGTFESDHQKLAEIYSYFREILKVYNVAGIGVCQASAEAEGKSKVHYSHAEGSKTAKGACADVVLGIGCVTDSSDVRYFNLSKNKLTGWHGAVAVKIVPKLSRYAV